MADLNRMDRTWLCSVVFMDIVQYSSQSVELQIRWKTRFNGYLTQAIGDVPETERVILDTGDGAAVCFLGAPEAAMFAALQLRGAFVTDEREQSPGLRVRIGVNLGPVKLVRDINGALNAIGDGINAGQRIMSFSEPNNILVSQSFFEVVSRLSDDFKPLFQLKGVEKDKHVREHTVYHLVPPGTTERRPPEPAVEEPPVYSMPEVTVVKSSGDRHAPRNGSMLWVAGGFAVLALGAAGAWHFYPSAVPAPSAVVNATEPPPSPAPAPKITKARVEIAPAAKPEPALPDPSPTAKAAYDEATSLLDQHKPIKAARRFDDALHADPNYVDAYVGRAQVRRALTQYELSLEDCNAVIRIKPSDPRGYNCRGYGYELLKQYEPALRDFNKAIGMNPSFAQAYADRGSAYIEMQQYDRAVQDYNQALRLRPMNAAFHLRRAAAYVALKDYAKAIQDDTEAIRLQPDDLKAYTARASAEELSGDTAAAAADRRHVHQSRAQK